MQDHHISQIAERKRAWEEGDWAAGFGLVADPEEHGFGHTPNQVAAVVPSGVDVVLGYHDAVAVRTLDYIAALDATELDRIVDSSWDPPVLAGVRLVSVIGDCYQHVGQAAYLKGLLGRT